MGRVAATVFSLGMLLYCTTATQLQQKAEPRKAYEVMKEYDIERLENVDMSRKSVSINVLVEDHPQTEIFRKHQDVILGEVQQFYARYGVDITYTKKRLPVAVNVIDMRVLDTVTFNNEIANAFIFRGLTNFEKRSFAVQVFDASAENENLYPTKWAKSYAELVSHELGHALSLPHTNHVPFDCVGTVYDQKDNLMNLSYAVWWGKQITLHPIQVRQIHSYLSKGQVYAITKPKWFTFWNNAAIAIRLRHEFEGNCIATPWR